MVTPETTPRPTGPARRRGWTPDDYLGWGLMISVIGGLLAGGVYFASAEIGLLMLAIVGFIGGLLLSIGIVAKGVQVGIRHSR